jgi:hypothetical protein
MRTLLSGVLLLGHILAGFYISMQAPERDINVEPLYERPIIHLLSDRAMLEIVAERQRSWDCPVVFCP